MSQFFKKSLISFTLFTCLLFAFYGLAKIPEHKNESLDKQTLKKIGEALNDEVSKQNLWPKVVSTSDSSYELEYTIDNDLQNYIEKLVKRHASDFSAVVVLDNNSGEVLAAYGQERVKRKKNFSLLLDNTHPAASLFKIVTSAALIEDSHVNSNTKFSFLGKSTTLYKYQLRNKKSRWRRSESLKKAFARSNNVIFAKAALNNLSSLSLQFKAREFGFQEEIMSDLDLKPSTIMPVTKEFNLAELASGFNKKTLITPIHGALFPYIVANEGLIRKPRIISKATNTLDSSSIVNTAKNQEINKVIELNTAKELKKMMEETIKRGTASKSFRGLPYKLRKRLALGGKTGSITGGKPYGKRDWFSAFAIPKNDKNDLGISICIMNINVKKWYVRAPFLASKIIGHYYKDKQLLSSAK